MPPGRNDPCHCGSGKKYKKCHEGIDLPVHLQPAEAPERCECCDKPGHKARLRRATCGRCHGDLVPQDTESADTHGPWTCSSCGAVSFYNRETNRFRLADYERAGYLRSRGTSGKAAEGGRPDGFQPTLAAGGHPAVELGARGLRPE